MNDTYQYSEKRLTQSMAQELIQELFAGQTVALQEIRTQVDARHIGRGGLLSNYKRSHPVSDALSKMKRLGLAENPEHRVWSIFSTESSETEAAEGQTRIRTLEDFLKWAQKFDRGEYVFRGVSSEKYGIQASAFRRPKKDRDFEKFLQVNRDLIRDARLRGYDQKDGRELKELEILAELQHFGAATCLIDFTYNAQVALRFTCEEDAKQAQDCNASKDQKNQKNLKTPRNGKVFAVRNKPPAFKEITPDLLKEKIDFFLQGGKSPQLYCWQPRQQNNRIIAQQSIFLFGRYEFCESDSCVIDGKNKEDIRNTLQQASGITEDSLFPDFEGFAHVRREETPYTELTASEYKERGFWAYDRASNRRDYEDAISDFDMAIDLQPSDAITHYLRGSANRKLEQYDEARADYDTAIDLDSDYVDAYRDRGSLNYQLQQYDEALEDFNMAIDLDSYDAGAYSGSGLTKYQMGLYDEALEDFNEAIDLDPNSSDNYNYRGIVKVQLRRIKDALEDFDKATHLEPNNVVAYFNRGLLKSRTFQHRPAILDFDEVIRLDANNADAYYHRAGSKLRLDLLESAKEDLLTAMPLAVSTGDERLLKDINQMLDEINFHISRGSQDE